MGSIPFRLQACALARRMRRQALSPSATGSSSAVDCAATFNFSFSIARETFFAMSSLEKFRKENEFISRIRTEQAHQRFPARSVVCSAEDSFLVGSVSPCLSEVRKTLLILSFSKFSRPLHSSSLRDADLKFRLICGRSALGNKESGIGATQSAPPCGLSVA